MDLCLIVNILIEIGLSDSSVLRNGAFVLAVVTVIADFSLSPPKQREQGLSFQAGQYKSLPSRIYRGKLNRVSSDPLLHDFRRMWDPCDNGLYQIVWLCFQQPGYLFSQSVQASLKSCAVSFGCFVYHTRYCSHLPVMRCPWLGDFRLSVAMKDLPSPSPLCPETFCGLQGSAVCAHVGRKGTQLVTSSSLCRQASSNIINCYVWQRKP